MNTHKILGLTPIAIAVALAAGTAAAHHSRANFNLDKVETYTGTVTRFAWTNPHTAIFVKTTTPDGQSIEMTIEGNSIPTMVRRGWSQTSLKPGDAVVVKVNPDKDPNRHFFYFQSVTKNGTEVGGGFGSRQAPPQVTETSEHTSADPLVGVWRPNFSFGGGGGPGGGGPRAGGPGAPGAGGAGGGRPGAAAPGGGGGGGRAILLASPQPSNLPVTAKGKASYATFPNSEDPRDRCIPESLPAAISTVPYMFEIKRQDDGNYLTLDENYAAPRTIHMNQTAPPAGTKPDYDGYSVGHMEGDTLVVKTTLFTPEPWGNDTGLDSSDEKSIVERYRVTNDGKRLEITYAQTDPVYLAKTVTRTLTWNATTSQLANVWDGSNCTIEAGERHLNAK